MKHAAPVMRSQGSGSIINNGSVAASRAGLSSSMCYSAAKAAVVHLTRCVAIKLGEDGVRVNAISPGGIATGIFGKAFGLPIEDAGQTAEQVKIALQGLQPIPRAGLPDDIANAAVFLASDESTFVNGHELIVDGGLVGGRMWTPQQEGLAAMRDAPQGRACRGRHRLTSAQSERTCSANARAHCIISGARSLALGSLPRPVEDAGHVLDELDPVVECSAGDHVEGHVRVAIVDALGACGAGDDWDRQPPIRLDS